MKLYGVSLIKMLITRDHDLITDGQTIEHLNKLMILFAKPDRLADCCIATADIDIVSAAVVKKLSFGK